MNNTLRLAQIIQNIGFGLFLIGVIFKILNYSFAYEFTFISGLTICLGVGLNFYLSEEKTWVDFLGLFAISIVLASLVSPYLFPSVSGFIGRLSGPSILFLIASQFLIKKEIEETPKQLENYQFGKEEEEESKEPMKTKKAVSFYGQIPFYTLSLIAAVGLVFKILHYPFASQLTIIGFTGTAILLIYRALANK